MRRYLVFWILLGVLLITQTSWAQQDYMKQQEELEQLQESLESSHEERERQVQEFLIEHNIPRYFISREGVSYFLDYIDEFGQPVYVKTFNEGAAVTVGVDKLRQGGGLGLNLKGTGLSIGVWEVFGVRQNHQEFGNRVLTQEAASEIDNHATHVAGTIMAAGVNSAARGMAPEARALLYTSNNDVSEMTDRASPGQSGILLSNHSYGLSLGWDFRDGNWQWNGNATISEQEDYRFGLYDAKSRDMDRLAFNAPYYLIVKSAGNDRSDEGDGSRPADGPYDIIGSWGNAKNILTVGAVEKINDGYTGPQDVQMSSFSSWGPTDDGRIKPDIVAAGVNILSPISTANDAYGSLSGTSMSAPNATGALALLQQLYKQETNNYMRSATLKGLIIHTAHKASNSDGPNYRFGWGLLNAEGAARHILQRDNLNKFIQERVLTQGQTYEVALNPEANKKITVTIAWTDPEGTPSPAVLDPTDLKLINDLDIRLVDDAGNEVMPYILNPASPGASAQRGDNFRDNVEKIEFFNPEPRRYRVVVSHKNSLKNGEQRFSLLISQTAAHADGDRQTLYWIGGSGDWNDASKWSLSSGGTSANDVPGPADRVVVDENSFPGGGQQIQLTSDVQVYSFTWLNKSDNGISLNGNTLRSDSDLLISSESFSVTTGGQFAIRGNGDFDLGPNSLPLLDLYFDAANGNWSVQDYLDVQGIQLNRGNLNMSGLLGDLRTLHTTGTNGKSLNLDGAEFRSMEQLLIEGSGLNMSTQNTIFLFSESGSTIVRVPGVNIDGRVNNPGSDLSVEGVGGYIRYIEAAGSIDFRNSFRTDSLIINDGSDLVIAANSSLDVNRYFDVESTASSPVTISSSDPDKAIISVDLYEKFCFDFLNITGVDYSGQAKVSVGLNSDLTNAAGWIEQSCEDVLFADFSVDYNCVNGLTYFLNTSSGNISSYSWDFGDGNISNNQDGFNQFTGFGPYEVNLTISNNNDVESVTRSIEMIENTSAGGNTIVQNEDQLVSERSGEFYQWFANGQLLNGETGRIYRIGSVGGEFFVLAFNEGCNTISDTVTVEVTSIDGPFGDSDIAEDVHVFPVPVSDELNVTWPADYGAVSIGIMDVNGRSIYSQEVAEGQHGLSISMQSYPVGMYWLRLEHRNGVFIRKLIK